MYYKMTQTSFQAGEIDFWKMLPGELDNFPDWGGGGDDKNLRGNFA